MSSGNGVVFAFSDQQDRVSEELCPHASNTIFCRYSSDYVDGTALTSKQDLDHQKAGQIDRFISKYPCRPSVQLPRTYSGQNR